MEMTAKQLMKRAHALAEPFRVSRGLLAFGIDALAEFQARLYAQDRWSLLLIFQAMDAAGKDGAIKHVMSGVNPQGCQVYSFKAPASEQRTALAAAKRVLVRAG
jgi:polyphosphate kinase 2 (PPK2 family)